MRFVAFALVFLAVMALAGMAFVVNETEQVIITRFRFQRSTRTPAIGARNRPGTTLAVMTIETAASGVPPPTLAAATTIAKKPNQSPVAETTWTVHNRAKSGVISRRSTRLRRPVSPSDCCASPAPTSSVVTDRMLLAGSAPIRSTTSFRTWGRDQASVAFSAAARAARTRPPK